MAVIIDQIEHVPTATGSRRGGEDRPSGDGPAAPFAESQLMAVLRREAGRQARLWAD